MTNIDKAAEVINEAWCDAQGRNEDGTAELFAQALSDAGLLAREPRVSDGRVLDAAEEYAAEMHKGTQTAPTALAVDVLRKTSFALGACWAIGQIGDASD